MKVAEAGAPELNRSDQVGWLKRFESDNENLRAAVEAAFESNDRELELRLVTALWWFWYVSGRWQEGRRSLSRALREGDAITDALRMKPLHGAAFLAQRQGDMTTWKETAEESLRLSRAVGDELSAGRALRSLATFASAEGDYTLADELFDQSTEFSRAAGDTWNLSILANNRGSQAQDNRAFREAIELFETAVSLANQHGDDLGASVFVINLGQTEIAVGEYTKAAAHIKEGLVAAQELVYREELAEGLAALAVVCALTDRPIQAATLLAAGIKAAESIKAVAKPQPQPVDT